MIPRTIVAIPKGEFLLFETRVFHAGAANPIRDNGKTWDTYYQMLESVLPETLSDATEETIHAKIALIENLRPRVHFAIHHRAWNSKNESKIAYVNDMLASLCEHYTGEPAAKAGKGKVRK